MTMPKSTFSWPETLRGTQRDKDAWMVRALALEAQLKALGHDYAWLLKATKEDAYTHLEGLTSREGCETDVR
jgi:hypothetical protein